MRDISLVLILLSFIWLAWLRPWVGVLALTLLVTVQPQGYADGFMLGFPVYLALFATVLLAAARDYLRQRRLPRIAWDWRLPVFLLLWAQFLFTTWYSIFPWAAWPKLTEVSKVFLALLPILLLIDTRDKLRLLIIAIAIGIGLSTFKGSYWAIMTGFSERVYGPPTGQIHGNNEFALAMTMNIPLLVLWLRQARQRHLQWLLRGLVALSYAAVISSWSRGGMLALAVVTLFLLIGTRNFRWYLPLLIAGALLASVTLPDNWFDRMGTLTNYQQDASAVSRIDIWQDGLEFTRQHPLQGTGFEGWIAVKPNRDTPIDWHSAYVEITAEHGFPGLLLWGALLLGSMANLTRLAWQARRGRAPTWVADYGTLLTASLAAYAVGSLFLGTAYWDLLYQLIAIAILVTQLGKASTNQTATTQDSVDYSYTAASNPRRNILTH